RVKKFYNTPLTLGGNPCLRVVNRAPELGFYESCILSQRGTKPMRFLFKFSIPVEGGNAAAQNGFKILDAILQEQKPEAAYFIAENGKRTAIVIMNMTDASQLPAIAEPWFLGLGAEVECTPCMVKEDLMKAGPAIEKAVKAYGK